MEYIIGNKEIFLEFLKNIGEKDRAAIITHADLDGVASAILINEILKSKNVKIDSLIFAEHKKDMLLDIFKKLNNKTTKIFILDIGIESYYKEYLELKDKFDVFLIDHHPSEIKDLKDAIKTKTEDCAALTIYEAAKEIFNLEKWKELICATMISEFSYKNEANFQFIKKSYPEITLDNISNSTIGEISKKISSALVYFKGKEKKVFDMILNRDTKKLNKYYNIIEEEVQKYVEKFRKEAEFFPEKNLYFYYNTPQFSVTSIVTSILSNEEKNKTFVFVSDIPNESIFVKVTSRNQSKKKDMGALMKQGIKNLENASGGGHVPAAAARLMKKDLGKFKSNILND